MVDVLATVEVLAEVDVLTTGGHRRDEAHVAADALGSAEAGRGNDGR